jgi:lipoprotein NlpD
VDTKAAEAKPDESKPTDDESITWVWPAQGKLIANFNEVSNKGIDIGGTTGQAINAASIGKVIYTGSDLRGYGKLVILKHNKTYLSVYAHNSKVIVKEGQIVAAGQKIAEMGNTDSNTVKLHFEIRRLGKSVDPAKYLNQI